MAGYVTGREVKMAFAKYATNSWGVAASVTKGIYFSSDAGIKLTPAIVTDDAFGQNFLKQSDVGNIQPPSPTLAAVSRYNDHTYIWDATTPTSGTPSRWALRWR
jgi:hypothetical protein